MQIHFTLIEAFCLENDILVLKVYLCQLFVSTCKMRHYTTVSYCSVHTYRSRGHVTSDLILHNQYYCSHCYMQFGGCWINGISIITPLKLSYRWTVQQSWRRYTILSTCAAMLMAASLLTSTACLLRYIARIILNSISSWLLGIFYF